MLRAAAARAHSNERAVGALSCARQLRGLRIDFRRQLHAAAAAAARSGAPQQWVFSRYGPLHQGLEFSATQRAAAAKLFRAGGTHEGTQLDPKYFAPGPGQAEVALIGRSNAGKSSLLNALLGQRLSSTSKRPGHTEDLHFFRVPARQELFLVDLPGYGYAAHRAKAQKAAWMELIAGYLHDRGRDGGGVCRRVLLLVDVRCVVSHTRSSATRVQREESPVMCPCTPLAPPSQAWPDPAGQGGG